MKSDVVCLLCRGPFSHALRLATHYAVDTDTVDREHRRIHELTRESRAKPGGSLLEARAIPGLKARITEANQAIDYLVNRGHKGPALESRRTRVRIMKEELEARGKALEALPPEATADLAKVVSDARQELAAIRITGDLEKIRDKAAAVTIAEAKRVAAHADLQAFEKEIQTVAGRARKALAQSLLVAFEGLRREVRDLCSDNALLEAPELVPMKRLESCFREGVGISDAFRSAVGGFVGPAPASVFDDVPVELRGFVGQAVGMRLPPPEQQVMD